MDYNFSWVPNYGSAVSKKPNVSAAKFGEGYEQRIASGLNITPCKWQPPQHCCGSDRGAVHYGVI